MSAMWCRGCQGVFPGDWDDCPSCKDDEGPAPLRELPDGVAEHLRDLVGACQKLDADLEDVSARTEALEAAAKDMWPLVDEVRAIVAEHYPDGSRHDDPEYERRRSVTAALVRQALALRDATQRHGEEP